MAKRIYILLIFIILINTITIVCSAETTLPPDTQNLTITNASGESMTAGTTLSEEEQASGTAQAEKEKKEKNQLAWIYMSAVLIAVIIVASVILTRKNEDLKK